MLFVVCDWLLLMSLMLLSLSVVDVDVVVVVDAFLVIDGVVGMVFFCGWCC